jgi:hypothetical protein
MSNELPYEKLGVDEKVSVIPLKLAGLDTGVKQTIEDFLDGNDKEARQIHPQGGSTLFVVIVSVVAFFITVVIIYFLLLREPRRRVLEHNEYGF